MEFLGAETFGMWAFFLAIVAVLVAFDLGVLNRTDKEINVKESLRLSLLYVIISLAFGGWIWWELGAQSANDFYTGYLLEKSLSLDNIFVISLVFGYFNIPRKYQHRVLFWGIIGVILLRGIFIASGTWLATNFEWVLYLFAAFLIFTGIKMLLSSDEEPDIENNFILKTAKKYLRVSTELHGNKFMVKLPSPKDPSRMQRYFTPLFLALVVIEFVDIIFALDSVPAILAVTQDPYIVYTSNIFAILGLRALYFALAAMLHRFEYLEYALAAVLIFIGGKVILAKLLDMEKIPSWISLTVTLTLLGGGVIVSLLKTRGDAVEKP